MKISDFKSKIKINKYEARQFKDKGKEKTSALLKKAVKLLKILLVVVIILGLFFMAAKQFANVSMSNMTDWVKGIILKSKPGEGYPYTVTDGGVIQSEIVGPYLAIVEKDKLIFLNSHAKDIFTYEHNFVDPVLKSKNGRAVFYSEGTTDFIITSSSEILHEYEKTSKVLDGGIITADIGRKGNVAFATWSDEFSCKISVFNQSLKQVFYYGFSSGKVVDISLSDDGNYLCAAVIDAKNATLFTRLMVFDLSKSDPVSDVKLSSQTGVEIEFLSGKNIELVTLSSVFNFNFSSDEEPDLILDYSGNDLQNVSFDNSSRKFSFAVKQLSSSHNTMYLFSSSGLRFKSTVLDSVKAVSRSSKYICCLTDYKIVCLKNNAKQLFNIDLNINVDNILVNNNIMYIFTGNQIYKVGLSAFTDFEIR